MSSPPKPPHRRHGSGRDGEPPTAAAFSPSGDSHAPEVTGTQRATILVQNRSPLLVATPPQITRALAYSHPFIMPLNRLAGLLSWTTGDPWESFLLVAAFWATCLYGDALTRYTAPLVVVMTLMLAMYVRRYTQLSSTGWTGEKQKGHKRGESESSVSQHKSLEDIVETLRLFTSRCNILLDPFLRMTDFLSTQTTATAATTRPALTALFIRIVLVTPLWIILTLPPWRIITTKRVILAIGTTVLTWHSQPARVTRTIFWRSRTLRRICSVLTGLDVTEYAEQRTRRSSTAKGLKSKTPHEIAASLAAKNGHDAGIRLTFTLYENQRRWLGIGWTSSMLAYERAAWTDEHNNTTAPKEKFELPTVEGGQSQWKWVPGSEWHVVDNEGDIVKDPDTASSDGGWIYYDNKWQNGRKGKDGWGKYTRRRRWVRDAELVEVSSEPPSLPVRSAGTQPIRIPQDKSFDEQSTDTAVASGKDTDTSSSLQRKKGWLSRRSSQPASEKSTAVSSGSVRSILDEQDEDVHDTLRLKELDNKSKWGLADDAEMSFG